MVRDNHQDDQTQSFVALTKGTMVGSYRIIEKIGAGGIGELHLQNGHRVFRSTGSGHFNTERK